MAKYYIQSGTVSFVIGAHDVEGAALWAMHRTIEKMVVAFEDECEGVRISNQEFGDDESDVHDPIEDIYEPMLDGLARFDETIKCSQIGFGREDAGTLETEEVFRHWRQLMQAADYLFDRLN